MKENNKGDQSMFFIFARSGSTHGMGHLSRSIALAYNLHLQGQEVAIITNQESLHHIPEKWFSVHAFDKSMYPADMIKNSVTMHRYDHATIIVDDKEVTDYNIRSLALDNARYISIDNPEANEKLPVYDMSVIPNFHMLYSEMDQLYRRVPKVLYGNSYVMLNMLLQKKCTQKNNLVTFFAGGSDPEGYTQRFFTIAYSILDKWQGHVMVGEMSTTHRPSFSLDTIAESSLFVCAWGVSVYESIALGTPVLTFTRNPEDYDRAAPLSRSTCGIVSVIRPGFSDSEMIDSVNKILSNEHDLKFRNENCSLLVDTLGAQRVASELIKEFGV